MFQTKDLTDEQADCLLHVLEMDYRAKEGDRKSAQTKKQEEEPDAEKTVVSHLLSSSLETLYGRCALCRCRLSNSNESGIGCLMSFCRVTSRNAFSTSWIHQWDLSIPFIYSSLVTVVMVELTD